ncbi:hypothetical protein ACIGW8_09725 [Streptomyces sioyaensis]|uniref:hypothetical protein n=1 Tax=Streptomyces sioyaensis TaxID=67364 RepID=UPI0037D91B64
MTASEYERRWLMRLLRGTAVLVLLDTLRQAALAGLFVTGNLDWLAWHAANAGVLSALTVVPAVLAVVVWRRLRGPGWPAAAGAALVGLVSVQQGLGEARVLAGHNSYVSKPALAEVGVIAALEESAPDGSRTWEPSREHGYHARRHFYASGQLEAGGSVVSLARWLGHSDPGFTLRRYAHFLSRAGARGGAAIDAVFA